MALPVQQQVQYWGIAAAVSFAVLWFLGDVILPFVLGMAVAYCLDPTADWLERRGLSRPAAVVIITLVAVVVFALGGLLVLPTLLRQLGDLVDTLPTMIQNAQTTILTHLPALNDAESTLSVTLSEFAANLRSRGVELLEAALRSVSSLVSIVTLLVITPVVSFYLLLDWDRLVASIDDLLPRDHAPTIRRLAHQVDRTLAGFIRGQGTVCLILGTFYATALMIVGLDFGLIVGAIAGALTFIPYIGALVGGALAIGLAVFQFWGDWGTIVAVAAIFSLGQMVEGNFLTPKLVGSSVGLHPVWLLLALSAFGTVFGFVGMLVAVPIAAVIGVFTRFFIAEYKTGRLYQGISGRPMTPRDPEAETAIESEDTIEAEDRA